ncbi:MAG: SURF1 family protein [Pseudomonadota bacterium]
MSPSGPAPRSRPVRLAALSLAGLVFFSCILLGNWQLRRLDWKLDLIEAVESRVNQPARPLPRGPVNDSDHAYLRIEISGRYVHEHTYRVKALTELGGGNWLLTPLQTERGHIWVNRGFIPTRLPPNAWHRPDGNVRVEGLLRMTEPGGTLLEDNDPAGGRWVSRDIAALQRDSGLFGPEDFFIDANHQGAPDSWPRGGLTRIDFRNTHLTYALTWYAMAIMLAAAVAYVVYLERRRPPIDLAGENGGD